MKFKFFILAIILLTFNTISFNQSIYESNLEDSFKKAKSENKNLLVYRYRKESLEMAEKVKYSSPEYKIDSLFKDPNFQKSFSNKFIIFPCDFSTNSIIDKNFIFENYPNFIVFSPDSNVVSYLNLIFYNGKQNMLKDIADSLSSHEPKVIRLNELNNKKNNGITLNNQELLEILRIKNILKLPSTIELNTYALQNGELNSEIANMTLNQDLNTTDPFVISFINSQKNESDWEDYKLALLDNLIDIATFKKNKIQYESAIKFKETYITNSIKKRQLLYGNKTEKEIKNIDYPLSELELEEKFNFYVSIADTLKVTEFGNKYAKILYTDFYITRNKRFNHDMPIKVRENELKSYNINTAEALNRLCWNYIQVVSDVSELKKSLKWIDLSIKLDKNPLSISTKAYNLFLLGFTKEAIQQQSLAVNEAKRNVKFKGDLKYLQDLLSEFKEQSK